VHASGNQTCFWYGKMSGGRPRRARSSSAGDGVVGVFWAPKGIPLFVQSGLASVVVVCGAYRGSRCFGAGCAGGNSVRSVCCCWSAFVRVAFVLLYVCSVPVLRPGPGCPACCACASSFAMRVDRGKCSPPHGVAIIGPGVAGGWGERKRTIRGTLIGALWLPGVRGGTNNASQFQHPEIEKLLRRI
jgi:hypothetical protein